MYSKLCLAFMLLFSVVLVGCGSEPTLDTSSEEAFKTSMERMTADMSPEEAAELQVAIQEILFDELFGSLGNGMPSEAIGASVAKEIDGLTASEILAKADKIKNSRK